MRCCCVTHSPVMRTRERRAREFSALRILCLTSWYPPHHFGGYELSCFDVMTRLAKRGHHVEILCSDERVGGVEDPNSADEARVHRTLKLYFRDGNLWSPPLRQRLAME